MLALPQVSPVFVKLIGGEFFFCPYPPPPDGEWSLFFLPSPPPFFMNRVSFI